MNRATTNIAIDVSQAIREGLSWCRAASRPPSIIITDDKLEMLTPEAFRELARRGWVSSVNDLLHHQRAWPAAAAKAVARAGTHPVAGRNPRGAWSPLQDIVMVGADGWLKALAQFDADDLESLRLEAVGQEKGWARRHRWAKRAAQLLAAHNKATRVEQLPKSQLGELAELAVESWL